jgi:hypothetical protein
MTPRIRIASLVIRVSSPAQCSMQAEDIHSPAGVTSGTAVLIRSAGRDGLLSASRDGAQSWTGLTFIGASQDFSNTSLGFRLDIPPLYGENPSSNISPVHNPLQPTHNFLSYTARHLIRCLRPVSPLAYLICSIAVGLGPRRHVRSTASMCSFHQL